MGAVYLGEHTMLGRPAAIKVLLPALSQNREMVGRFFNEARAITAIRHPGIVEVYDFGFLPDGAAYIVMEMLDGESLASRLRRSGRLPLAAVVDIGRQVAAALHAAHGRGITHRDLKPDNMFLTRDPEIGERVKLLDFGIAKLVTEEGGNRTRTGVVMGTPVYMSPEQCRGAAGLDSRADLYSLGCVLYELLIGRPPFVAESAGDIIAHHLYFQPEPVRKHDPSVPEPLEQLIMALLAKEPAMRPASAADVIATLDGWRATGAVPAGSAMRSSPMPMVMPPAVAPVPTGNPVVIAAPTTLSGSAGAVGTSSGRDVGPRAGSSRRRFAAIGAAVVAAGAILIAVMMRPADPPAGPVAASVPASSTAPASAPAGAVPSPRAPPAAPSVVEPPASRPQSPATVDRATPPGPEPAAVASPAPAVMASAPSADTPAEHPPRKHVGAAPSKPAATPTKKGRDTAAVAPASREEAKPVAAVSVPPAEPVALRAEPVATPPKPEAAPPKPEAAAQVPPAATAQPPNQAPAQTPPAPAVSQKTEPKPAQPGAPAKPATSKWGRLTGDKNVNPVDYRLLQECKDAAAKGDCALARTIAARIAEKNVAMYQARVMTDAAVAACLKAK